MEFIDQECSSGEETSEPTSEYDSSIYSDNDDIEFISASSSDENYFAPNNQKSKTFVSDDDSVKLHFL